MNRLALNPSKVEKHVRGAVCTKHLVANQSIQIIPGTFDDNEIPIKDKSTTTDLRSTDVHPGGPVISWWEFSLNPGSSLLAKADHFIFFTSAQRAHEQ
ncbi:hypothetical protein [Fibrella aquatica]|uniref:hypothetical protein n=1 Tax=Fibrella aquatica TaxID=3242487 RepID=UPI0035210FA3